MTPKEKAFKLFTDFHQYYWDEDLGWMPDEKESKKMAIKVVDEILNVSKSYAGKDYEFYQEVKKEIEKL